MLWCKPCSTFKNNQSLIVRMKTFKNSFLLILVIALSMANTAIAKVTLPTFFTDNMVLQQNSSVPFFGTSSAAAVKVTTSWDNKSYSATAKNGKWEVSLATPKFGGPYTITISDGDNLVLKNILIGEVWLCSGQSNMEMPLEGWGKVDNYKEEIKNANYPEIRLLQAEHVVSAVPLETLQVQNGGWQVCSPATIAGFSSTAYFFARKEYKEKHIPIGLIHSSWGGTVAEAWTSAGALNTMHDFDEVLKGMASEPDKNEVQKKYNADIKVWNAELEKADKGGLNGNTAVFAGTDYNDASWKTMQLPNFWEFDALVGFDGIAWFRKTVALPENFAGKDAELEFYADDNDKVWVNGTYIGGTDGYTVQRHYTLPGKLLKKGNNTITIRVFDGTGGGGIYGNPADMFIKSGSEKVSLAGDWKYAVGVDTKTFRPAPYLPQGQNRPSALYNAMIHPILKYKLAGVIWYQGESNADRAKQYQTLFPLLISDWRAKFGNKDLPFYFVQLANYMQVKDQPGPSAWAELREAQLKTLSVPNTGMAVITDIGDAKDIHPKNKQDVGERLARIALAKTYGVKIDYSGPVYASNKKSGKTITVEFKDNNGLQAKDSQALKGFEIAGDDQKFYRADAKIENGKVVVSSAQVANPVAVRYNWADNPQGNLTNASGLPASSFRTDTWKGITEGNK